MAFVDDPNSNKPPTQIAGSTPLSQGSAANAPQEASNQSSGGSGGSPMESTGQAPQAPRKATRGSGKASSGAYTNIQKYVNKNQPQAQNIAGAVTQNVEKQAQSIQNVAKQKQQDQANLINKNNELMENQRKEAAGIIYDQSGVQVGGYEAPVQETGGQREGPEQQQKPQLAPTPDQVGEPFATYQPRPITSYRVGEPLPNLIQKATEDQRRVNEGYDNWVKSNLGDKYDEYNTKLSEISNRMLPMDIGPGSANERASQQMQKDREALMNEYGVGKDNYSVSRFQELMSGPQGTANVGALNLAQQQNRAGALQQLAASGRTEQGRRNMLKDTFEKQGAYNRGMSGLDNLILGGDASAREAIVQGTDQTGRALVDNLRGLGQESRESLAGYQDAVGQFGGQIRGLGETAETQLDSEFDTDYEKFVNDRRNFLESQYGSTTSDLEKRRAENLAMLGVNETEGFSDVDNYAQSYAQQLAGGNTDLWSRGNKIIGDLAGGNVTTDNYYGIQQNLGELEDDRTLGRINEDKFYQANQELLKKIGYGTEADLGTTNIDQLRSDYWKNSRGHSKASEDQMFKMDSLGNAYKNLIENQKGLDFNELVKSGIQEGSNVGYEDLVSGSDVDKYSVAGQENVGRYNRLNALLGDNGIADEQLKKDYSTQDTLRKIFNKYKVK